MQNQGQNAKQEETPTLATQTFSKSLKHALGDQISVCGRSVQHDISFVGNEMSYRGGWVEVAVDGS